MRLLVVSQYFWPENFRINDLVAELVQRGHDVTVLTGLPNYPDGKIFSQFRDEPRKYSVFSGADIFRVPIMERGRSSLRLICNYLTFAISASVIGLWKLRNRKFDAIFVFEPSPITVGLPAVLFRAVKRAPLVFWVLDLWPETLQAIGVVQSPLILRAIGKLVSFIYRRCDLILAQSRSFIPQIRKYAAIDQRIEFFPSWSDTQFSENDAAPAIEVPLKADSFNVLFAGNIGEAQDFPAILAAAQLLQASNKIRWLVVGDGRLAGWVTDEIKRRGLQDSFLMLGQYPLQRMPSFFKHAQVLLVSLKSEPIFAMTIPGKLQSYLAAGIPIMAMLDGEGAEIVDSSSCGLTCKAGDYSGLADAILRLAEMSDQEREIMAKNALDISSREFDRKMLVDKLEKWLVNLAIHSGTSFSKGSL